MPMSLIQSMSDLGLLPAQVLPPELVLRLRLRLDTETGENGNDDDSDRDSGSRDDVSHSPQPWHAFGSGLTSGSRVTDQAGGMHNVDDGQRQALSRPRRRPRALSVGGVPAASLPGADSSDSVGVGAGVSGGGAVAASRPAAGTHGALSHCHPGVSPCSLSCVNCSAYRPAGGVVNATCSVQLDV